MREKNGVTIGIVTARLRWGWGSESVPATKCHGYKNHGFKKISEKVLLNDDIVIMVFMRVILYSSICSKWLLEYQMFIFLFMYFIFIYVVLVSLFHMNSEVAML